MLKKVIYYTRLPQRAKTRPFPFEAAGEVYTAGVPITPAHPKRTKLFPGWVR